MTRVSRPLATLRLLVLAGLVLGSTGCARLFSSYDIAPNGMPRRDDALRRLLVEGRADSALARVAPKGESAPEDELLRSLYGGILAHYAGAYDSSSASLERAADLAEDRYTKRISRAALSLITNDKVLPYEPSETERFLIHYYAALNYLRLNDLEGAAVEARRLSALLEREEVVRDSTLHGWLRYFGGTVFEAAGEWNDAEVAYRNARALLGPHVEIPERRWRIVAGPSDDLETDVVDGISDGMAEPVVESGEVVVLLEEGFVAHRVEQAIVLPLFSFELDRLSTGSTGDRLAAATLVAARVLSAALAESAGGHRYYDTRPRTLRVRPLPREVALRECAEEERKKRPDEGKGSPARSKGSTPKTSKQPLPAPVAGPGTVTGSAGGLRDAVLAGSSRSTSSRSTSSRSTSSRSTSSRRSASRSCANLRKPYLLKVAWPVYRLERRPTEMVRVATDAALADERSTELQTNVSAAVVGDFDGERSEILTRTILRGVTKAVVTRGLERAPGDDDSGLGQVLGVLFDLGSALLEQADTRSWQLLPDRIRLMRLQLPPGEHEIAIEVGSAGSPRRIELGTVRVVAGGMSFVSGRVWP